jgi:AAA+ superfamily predicted ATPase
MRCGQTYTVDLSLPSTDTVAIIESVCTDYSGSFPTKGCKYIYKAHPPKEFSTCIEVGSLHLHGFLKNSDDLRCPDTPGAYFYASPGPFILPRITAKSLGLSKGAKAVIRNIKLETASEVHLQCLFSDQPQPCIPKLIWKGLEIVPKTDNPHPIYGGVFTQINSWLVVDIKARSPSPCYKYSKSFTKTVFLPPARRFLPKNLYKLSNPAGICGKLSSISSASKTLANYSTSRCIFWLHSSRGCGKRAAVFKSGWLLSFPVQEVSMFAFTSLSSFEDLLSTQSGSSILHVRHFPEALAQMSSGQAEVVFKVRDALGRYLGGASGRLLVLSSSDGAVLPGVVRNLCVATQVGPPTAVDRERIVRLLHGECSRDVVLATAGRSVAEMQWLCEQHEAGKDMEKGLRQFRATSSGIPNVRWEDVGGLAVAKQEIIDTIQLPLQRPEMFKLKPRTGLLLHGPPGTGKTLLAKAIATECRLNFIPVKGPELLNMYVGESERNVRELFERARNLQPCVLFFDELDSLAPKRGQGNDSGVMDRIVAQLLTEIDGLHSSSQLFVIGATNRPDLLDPALLRPGRFDKMIHLDIATDLDSKVKIFEAQTHRFKMQGVDLRKIAEMCSGNYSGADIYAICAQAVSLAFQEKAMEMEKKLVEWNEQNYYSEALEMEDFLELKKEDLKVEVEQRHFEKAISEVTPSISSSP